MARMEARTEAEIKGHTEIMTIIPADMITTTMAVGTARVDMIQVRKLNLQSSRTLTNCTTVFFVCFQQATTTMVDQAVVAAAAIVEIMVNTTIIKIDPIKINTKALDAGLCLVAQLIHLSNDCVITSMCPRARDCPKPLLKFIKNLVKRETTKKNYYVFLISKLYISKNNPCIVLGAIMTQHPKHSHTQTWVWRAFTLVGCVLENFFVQTFYFSFSGSPAHAENSLWKVFIKNNSEHSFFFFCFKAKTQENFKHFTVVGSFSFFGSFLNFRI